MMCCLSRERSCTGFHRALNQTSAKPEVHFLEAPWKGMVEITIAQRFSVIVINENDETISSNQFLERKILYNHSCTIDYIHIQSATFSYNHIFNYIKSCSYIFFGVHIHTRHSKLFSSTQSVFRVFRTIILLLYLFSYPIIFITRQLQMSSRNW